ncbi:MAG TPA: hypothetical protein VGL81_30470 [Polyangiaceae bacterium]
MKRFCAPPRAFHLVGLVSSLAVLAGCAQPLPPRTASQGGSRWLALRTTHLLIETDLAEDDARSLSQTYETAYRELAAVVIPGAEGPRERAEIVVFRDEDEFHAFGSWRLGGFFFDRGPIDLERHPTIVLYAPRYGALLDDGHVTLLHELTHRLIHHVYGWAPIWMNEGLAQYFSTMRIDDGKVFLGEPPRWTVYNPDVLPPVSALLAMDYQHLTATDLPDDYTRTQKTANNYLGAWALVHFFRNGPDSYRGRFQRFVSDMNRGARAKEAWSSAFGDLPAATLEADYRSYLTAERWDVFTRPLTRATVEPLESVDVIADADVHLLWLRTVAGAAGSPMAITQLVEAQDDAPRSAEVSYWRGSVDFFLHRFADARAAFEVGLRQQPDDPRTLFGLIVTLDRLARTAPPEGRAEMRGAAAMALTRLARTAASADELALVAQSFAAAGQMTEALARADAAIALDPGSYSAHSARARVLASASRYAEAVAEQERAVALAQESLSDSSLENDLQSYRRLARSQ